MSSIAISPSLLDQLQYKAAQLSIDINSFVHRLLDMYDKQSQQATPHIEIAPFIRDLHADITLAADTDDKAEYASYAESKLG